MAVNCRMRERILRFIHSRTRSGGPGPTVREIGLAVGLRSTASVYGYIQRMERDGLLERDPLTPRSIRPAQQQREPDPPPAPAPSDGALRVCCTFDLPAGARVEGVIALITDGDGRPLNPSRALSVTTLQKG